MSYDPVHIVNSTNYIATGTVHYPTIFCDNDDFMIAPGKDWTASGRGSASSPRSTP